MFIFIMDDLDIPLSNNCLPTKERQRSCGLYFDMLFDFSHYLLPISLSIDQ